MSLYAVSNKRVFSFFLKVTMLIDWRMSNGIMTIHTAAHKNEIKTEIVFM